MKRTLFVIVGAVCLSSAVYTAVSSGESAVEERLLGLWYNEHGCYVHIGINEDGKLYGAAWGGNKESMALEIREGQERRFPWKRKTRKSGFADPVELRDPGRKGRFIVNLHDKDVLHTDIALCYYPKSEPFGGFERISGNKKLKTAVPEWYRSSYRDGQDAVIKQVVEKSTGNSAGQKATLGGQDSSDDGGGGIGSSVQQSGSGLGGLFSSLQASGTESQEEEKDASTQQSSGGFSSLFSALETPDTSPQGNARTGSEDPGDQSGSGSSWSGQPSSSGNAAAALVFGSLLQGSSRGSRTSSSQLGSVASLFGGGSGGAADTQRANQLLAVAAKAEMQMYQNFSLALGRKEQADAFRQMADSISEDTIAKDWKKKNQMIDENPMSENDLASIEAEQAVYLQVGYGFGSVALLNYGILTVMLVKAVKVLKDNPLGNLGKITMMVSAIQAIPKGISTITSMLSTSRKVAKKHNIKMPSKQEIARLSEEAGGEADVSGLPD